jgi:hypothetical protein
MNTCIYNKNNKHNASSRTVLIFNLDDKTIDIFLSTQRQTYKGKDQ